MQEKYCLPAHRPAFIHRDPLCEFQFGDEVIEQNVVTEIFIHDNTHTSLVIMLDKKHDCSCKVVVVHEREDIRMLPCCGSTLFDST